MELNDSILIDTRESLGLSRDDNSFDKEIIPHINVAIGKLSQNGIGLPITVKDSTTTWGELQDPDQMLGNKYFHMVPLFITLNTKLLFDPPPPSSVEYHASNIDQILWRLKIAYEEM